MENEEIRSVFQREVLPDLFLKNPGVFYNAFNQDSEAVNNLIKQLWAYICNQGGDHVNNHPLHVSIQYIVVDDSKDNFTCLMIMELPNLKKVKNLAVYIAVFFGVKKELRLFLGETDYGAFGANRYIFLIELKVNGEEYIRDNHGFLFKGCNNEPLLFENLHNPKEPDQLWALIRKMNGKHSRMLLLKFV